MNRPPPKLRQKPNGYYFVRFGGKDHYCGTSDRLEAEKIYPKLLEKWSDWKATVAAVRTAHTSRVSTVDEIADEFIAAKVAQRGPQIERYYRAHLKLFRASYGDIAAITITPQYVQSFQSRLVSQNRYTPKTINHHVIAIKALFNWAADMGFMPALRLRAIRAIPVGESRDRALPLETIKGWISTAAAHDENVASWLAVNYLTMARPIEVCRVVAGIGEWEDDGIFRLGKSKVEYKTGVAKRLVFSVEALAWLSRCKPVWSRSDSYWHAVRGLVSNAKPGLLRHSAATALLRVFGTHRLDVETLLGHSSATRRESVRYAQIEWSRFRKLISQLTLKPECTPVTTLKLRAAD